MVLNGKQERSGGYRSGEGDGKQGREGSREESFGEAEEGDRGESCARSLGRKRQTGLMLMLFAAAKMTYAQCGIEPPVIKPVPRPGCSDLVHECVCDRNGRCYWSWVCVRSAPAMQPYPSSPPGPSMPDIANGIHPPQVESLTETAIRAEQLRQLQLRNEELRRRLYGDAPNNREIRHEAARMRKQQRKLERERAKLRAKSKAENLESEKTPDDH
jgi:hypothetical protein